MAGCFTGMSDYICEFADGTSAPVTVAGTWGTRQMVGTAVRGDGKVRVLFFSDPNGDGWFIPRDGDLWVRNIRHKWAMFGSRKPGTRTEVPVAAPGARRLAEALAARIAAEEWPVQDPAHKDSRKFA